MKLNDRCEKCRFMVSFGTKLQCHRYAPKPRVTDAGPEAPFFVYWPEVDPDDVCGEYEEAK